MLDNLPQSSGRRDMMLKSFGHPGIRMSGSAIVAIKTGLLTILLISPLRLLADRMETFQHELDTGKDPSGRPLTPEEKEDLQIAVAGGKTASEAVSAEFRNLRVKAADVTFDHQLDVDLGNRKVQLKYLGRGNTVGDAIAYLPKEGIVITGDLVDSPVPYFGSGFPIGQIATLKKMNELDFETLVPGHGSVLKGKAFLQLEIALIEALVDAINQEIGRTSAEQQKRFEEIKNAVERNGRTYAAKLSGPQ
jgi:glyoxylase-like metal-dependent hydrolase (beta-lactamase superfamily II)